MAAKNQVRYFEFHLFDITVLIMYSSSSTHALLMMETVLMFCYSHAPYRCDGARRRGALRLKLEADIHARSPQLSERRVESLEGVGPPSQVKTHEPPRRDSGKTAIGEATASALICLIRVFLFLYFLGCFVCVVSSKVCRRCSCSLFALYSTQILLSNPPDEARNSRTAVLGRT